MKKALLTLVLAITFFPRSQAQNCINVQLEKMQVLYAGIENPLKIHVNDNSSNLTLVSKNLTFIPSKEPNVFLTTPKRASSRKGFNIYVLNEKKDTVQVKNVRVKRLPDAAVMVLHHKTGVMSKGKLKVISRVDARMENFDFEVKLEVLSFDLTIIDSESSTKVVEPTKGNKITPKMKSMLNGVSSGSIVIFENIKVRYQNTNIRKQSAIVLRVK